MVFRSLEHIVALFIGGSVNTGTSTTHSPTAITSSSELLRTTSHGAAHATTITAARASSHRGHELFSGIVWSELLAIFLAPLSLRMETV